MKAIFPDFCRGKKNLKNEILGYSLAYAGLNPEASCFIIIFENCFSPFYFLCLPGKCEKERKKLFLTQDFQDILVLSQQVTQFEPDISIVNFGSLLLVSQRDWSHEQLLADVRKTLLPGLCLITQGTSPRLEGGSKVKS